MRIKTSDLSGMALDWAVASAQGYEIVLDLDGSWDTRTISHQHYSKKLKFNNYRPSESWAQGGLIIEREGIALFLNGKDEWAATDGIKNAVGDAPLIAAMRCYVASKLGDEVEIPDELSEVV